MKAMFSLKPAQSIVEATFGNCQGFALCRILHCENLGCSWSMEVG